MESNANSNKETSSNTSDKKRKPEQEEEQQDLAPPDPSDPRVGQQPPEISRHITSVRLNPTKDKFWVIRWPDRSLSFNRDNPVYIREYRHRKIMRTDECEVPSDLTFCWEQDFLSLSIIKKLYIYIAFCIQRHLEEHLGVQRIESILQDRYISKITDTELDRTGQVVPNYFGATWWLSIPVRPRGIKNPTPKQVRAQVENILDPIALAVRRGTIAYTTTTQRWDEEPKVEPTLGLFPLNTGIYLQFIKDLVGLLFDDDRTELSHDHREVIRAAIKHIGYPDHFTYTDTFAFFQLWYIALDVMHFLGIDAFQFRFDILYHLGLLDPSLEVIYPPSNEQLNIYNHPAKGDLLRGFCTTDRDLEYDSARAYEGFVSVGHGPIPDRTS